MAAPAPPPESLDLYIKPGHTRRTVCVSTSVVMEHSPDGVLRVMDSAMPALAGLASHSHLVLVTKCTNVTAEKSAMAALTASGLLGRGLQAHRVLFCTTPKGKIAIVRHLEPSLFVDDDVETLRALLPFIHTSVHVNAKAPLVLSSSPVSTPSLADLFPSSVAPAAAAPASAPPCVSAGLEGLRQRPVAAATS